MRVAVAVAREMMSGGSWPILACSAAGWVSVVGLDHSILVPTLCAPTAAADWTGASTVAVVIAINAQAQIVSCFAMLLAMMTPLVWLPLAHVWDRSLAERRLRAGLLFLCGFLGVWMVAMTILTFLAVALRLVAGSAIVALAISAGIAFLWQLTPVKARFLKRCHAVRPLPAFGLSAEIASVRYGMEIGRSCVVTCWALMLLPLTIDVGHVLTMAATALLMISERYSDRGYLRLPIVKLNDMIRRGHPTA
jgi:predicted metal-binding membrane protein